MDDAFETRPASLADLEHEVQTIARRLAEWADEHSTVLGLAIVGSWARGGPSAASDLDLILITDDPDRFAAGDGWLEALGRPPIVGRRQFGAITERRVRLPSGLEVEVGIGLPSWAVTDPADPGTVRVVSDGLWILHDPKGALAALQTAVYVSANRPVGHRDLSAFCKSIIAAVRCRAAGRVHYIRWPWSFLRARRSRRQEVLDEIERRVRDRPESEPMDPDDIFLTDLIVHSTGTVRVQEYVENGEGAAFEAWLASAIAKGWVTRHDAATVSVTDAGRERFAEINQPVTYTSPDGRFETTFRRV